YYTKSCRTEYSGMNPNGPNVIYIGDNCYGSNVFVQSLIMQVLGLEAEHNRRDRDNYVKIYPENLQPHFAKFFKKDRINTTVTYNIQYDYGSVIHGSQFIYTDRYYVKSIKALGEHDVYYQRMIGQRKGISFTEFKLINYHYCNNSCSQNITCYWNGYQSPNRCHECECPFPFFGKDCVSIRPSEKIVCPDTRLTALDKEQKIEYWGWRQCYNLITANNSDATVHIRITYIYFDDFKFCSRGGHNFLEVKYRADRGVMGVCFCYKLFDFEHNIYTEDRHAVLIYHGYYQTARAYLFYNQHIPSPLDRPKE
uniref:Metalloendopeptidase n=1 Tax=Parastrongyloides trichosuri TaxID=131310 RepID=A0A0N4ZED5_PARTI